MVMKFGGGDKKLELKKNESLIPPPDVSSPFWAVSQYGGICVVGQNNVLFVNKKRIFSPFYP